MRFKPPKKKKPQTIPQLVDSLIKAGKADEIPAALKKYGVSTVVVEEWAGEARRRHSALKKRVAKALRKEDSNFGRHKQFGRRIIKSKIYQQPPTITFLGAMLRVTPRPDRELSLHATKGWRDNRILT